MKILFVYPKFKETFWSLKYALRFLSKKAVQPPLGLLTVAALLPSAWKKKLIDMNVERLKDKDLKQADYVFISAISLQRDSVLDIVRRCRELGVKTVAGGPLFTTAYRDFKGIDHFILNEAEITLPPFLKDLKEGKAKQLYTSSQRADIRSTPAPLWELINMKKYAMMNIQYSRGCPFDCEFCDITRLYGHRPRVKEPGQIISELQKIYDQGWRDGVFFVDDNFIGNKKKLKDTILPGISGWMREKKYPFIFNTQASLDISDDEELMRMMAETGFNAVFVGIETTSQESLTECSKLQNKNRDMVECVKKIHNAGLQVQGGFIVGFDHDTPAVFQQQISFIQKSGIVTAMVGLLNAPQGTKLYRRLKKEKRLLNFGTGDNTDSSINFVPKMNSLTLISGYKNIVATIYSPSSYYSRIKTFLREYRPLKNQKKYKPRPVYLAAFLKSVLILGVIGRERIQYWKLLLWCLFKQPGNFPLAITLAIKGFHFRKIFQQV